MELIINQKQTFMRKLHLLFVLALALGACQKTENQVAKDARSGAKRTTAVTNYYVNGASGNDANTGTSAGASLKTIQAALNKTVNGAGSNIYVAAGTYKERLAWPNSGASSAEPIKLTNYNNGVVTLDGVNATNNGQAAMIQVASKSHIRIDHINITNNTRSFASGIYISGSGTDVHITFCKISNVGWTTNASAIPASGDNANPLVIIGTGATSYSEIFIGSNEVYNCNTGYSEGLTLGGNVENFLIQSNIVHDIKNIGIDMTGNYSWTGAPANVNFARNGNVKYNTVYRCVSPVATSGGIYVDGGKWINIEGNTCYENYAGISVGCENNNYNTEGINVRSNFVYNNGEAGLLIGSNQPNSKVISSTVTNNTFYKNYSIGGWGGEIFMQNMNNVSFKNNIIHSLSNIVVIAGSGYLSTNLSFDYNKYYSSGTAANLTFDWGGNNGVTYGSFSSFQTNTGLDANSTFGTPGYVSGTLPTPNLHLASTSACVNAGLPTFVVQSGEFDIDAGARKVNTRVDIGADETPY
jgi:hypothetical protein